MKMKSMKISIVLAVTVHEIYYFEGRIKSSASVGNRFICWVRYPTKDNPLFLTNKLLVYKRTYVKITFSLLRSTRAN